ncbi:phytoene desaturase family protein [Myceligenerans salitolerans]|uniref:Phytoene desaturase n=1 Tax=Myceligenerans salitolerans TaxID=1230528 RepID=A0ABS3I5S5_9MICO|nr:phytoene desaturase family protein [Myceligenerans salitolerans]MBO0607813.1 phytoene desaturase [Myceligenerans salitolerans]
MGGMNDDGVRGQRVVVIGGGFSGLATAALLAREGAHVSLFEAREALGGRAGSWERDGFRFDTGPSWYLMPEVFDHFFRMLGTTADDELDLVRLDPSYRVYFEGTAEPFDLPASGAREALLGLDPASGRRLSAYLDSAAITYRLATRHFLYSTFTSLRPFLDREVVRGLPRLLRLLAEPLDRFAARHTGDDRVRRILGYPAVFLGTSPGAAPSMYHLMSHLDVTQGVFYPRGGLTAVVDATAGLARRAGAELLTDHRVERIVVDGGRATGVEVSHAGRTREVAADVVVSTADLHVTEHRLLDARHRSRSARWWRRRDPGPGAVLALLGVRGELPRLAHHSLLFAEDWDAGFDAIFGGRREVPNPASLYVCRPSATDDVAPAGHENLFVLVPVPADTSIGSGGVDGGGDTRVERIVDDAIAQIGAWTGTPDLADRVVVRRTIGPADFEREFGAFRGGALGPAHTLRQSALFRGSNASARVSGLLYAGATTIPGIGLPMCLISAELVLKRLRGETGAGPLAEPGRAPGSTSAADRPVTGRGRAHVPDDRTAGAEAS